MQFKATTSPFIAIPRKGTLQITNFLKETDRESKLMGVALFLEILEVPIRRLE